MPTIDVQKKDFFSLLMKKVSSNQLKEVLKTAKAEIDHETEHILKIELKDTNRPDLWTTAGMARHINQYLGFKKYNSPFITKKSEYKILVDEGLKKIRPFIIGFIIKDLKITENLLLELIQNQEKLAMNFGKKRQDIAIGIYKNKKIKYPIHYKAVDPEEIKYIPLGETKELNLREILEQHPKGIEFGSILKAYKKYPIILDSDNHVLSFPPIINSRYIGEVEVGDSEIFIELTGFHLPNLLLVANIFACDFKDRGAEIIPVEVQYPYETDYTKKIVVPYSFKNKIKFSINAFQKITGYSPKPKDIKNCLKKMGYPKTVISKNNISIDIPLYRNDILHFVDIIEDYIIGKGYNNITPQSITDFTIGSLSQKEFYIDKLRNIAIGMEFQEIISNILNSKENIYNKLDKVSGTALEITNPMTENYNMLRNSIIPSLLEVETYSAKADYPHKIFEIGEVVIRDLNESYAYKTLFNLGLLSAHPKANFSEMKSYLTNILYYFNINDFIFNNIDIPFLLEGRNAEIIYNNKIIGYLGELQPKVLEKWDIKMPCSILELYINNIIK